jgi:hypothetical protein
MNNETDKKKDGFFRMPEYFFDYGLQCFTHTEYDVLSYILRNTIGWNRLECEVSIKKIALMKHYSEKNIIKSINNLIRKTDVFTKLVYRDKGSCIKKTKYIITENSVKILNDYIKRNIPENFNEKLKNLKNRSMEAMERLEQGRKNLFEKQQELLQSVDTENNNLENESTNEKKEVLLSAFKEIINDYNPDTFMSDVYPDGKGGYIEYDLGVFKYWKRHIYDSYITPIPKEIDDEKIDMRLSDMLPFTDDLKTINFYKTLIKNKKMIDRQQEYFYNTLKINFGIINEKYFDRINVIYE